MTIKLIVGLRNPGASYTKTRHNAGGWFAEQLAKNYNATYKIEKKFHCEMVDVAVNDYNSKVVLPLTFMNQSGLSVRTVAQFYRIKPEEILVAHDELDLPPGRIKLKTGGGHGGHNGLRDIIQQLGSNHFHRLRVGIGHPGHKELVLNYVLGSPSVNERRDMLAAIDRAIDILPTILTGNMANAMNQLNG